MDNEFEISRLRDWRHDKVDPTLAALLGRNRENEKSIERAHERITRVTKKVDELVKADEIADAVADRVRARNKLELSWVQKAGAIILFAVAVLDFFGIHFG